MLKTISLNKLAKMSDPPVFVGPRSVLNSLCKEERRVLQIKTQRDGIVQYI